jgi:hypothetical protein
MIGLPGFMTRYCKKYKTLTLQPFRDRKASSGLQAPKMMVIKSPSFHKQESPLPSFAKGIPGGHTGFMLKIARLGSGSSMQEALADSPGGTSINTFPLVLKDAAPLVRTIRDQWIMRAILRIYLEKPVHTQEHPEFWFQVLPRIDSKYVEFYRGFGGLAPKVTDSGE